MLINKNLSAERACEASVAKPKQTNFPFPSREGDKGDGFIKISYLFYWISINKEFKK